MNQTRKAKERDDLVHLLRQVRRTENRRVMEMVVMTEVYKTHQNLLVQVRQEKQTDYLESTSKKKKVVWRGHSCNYWHVPEWAKLKSTARCRFGDTCVYKHTAGSAEEKKNQQPLQIIHILANDEHQMQLQKAQSDDKTQFRVRLHHLANRNVLKTEKRDQNLELSRQDPK